MDLGEVGEEGREVVEGGALGGGRRRRHLPAGGRRRRLWHAAGAGVGAGGAAGWVLPRRERPGGERPRGPAGVLAALPLPNPRRPRLGAPVACAPPSPAAKVSRTPTAWIWLGWFGSGMYVAKRTESKRGGG